MCHPTVNGPIQYSTIRCMQYSRTLHRRICNTMSGCNCTFASAEILFLPFVRFNHFYSLFNGTIFSYFGAENGRINFIFWCDSLPPLHTLAHIRWQRCCDWRRCYQPRPISFEYILSVVVVSGSLSVCDTIHHESNVNLNKSDCNLQLRSMFSLVHETNTTWCIMGRVVAVCVRCAWCQLQMATCSAAVAFVPHV